GRAPWCGWRPTPSGCCGRRGSAGARLSPRAPPRRWGAGPARFSPPAPPPLRRAAELLESGPDSLLPARALLIHGFADATGVATDLLAALVRRRSAWVLLDRPPEPAGALGLDEAAGVERAYTERLAERLAAVLPPGEAGSEPAVPPAPRIAAIQAMGPDAVCREVAVRLRAASERGARPEGIGIVARDLGRFRLALRRHLRRLGVPFSGVGGRGSAPPRP